MGNKKGKQKREKKHIRSALTGRIINGKDVILTEEAIEYTKKMGFSVKPVHKTLNKSGLLALGLMTCFSIALSPLVSAQPVLFTFDFSLKQNQFIFSIFMLLSLFLFYVKQRLWSGTLILFGGMFMAFNNINIIISLIVMSIGVIVITAKEDNK